VSPLTRGLRPTPSADKEDELQAVTEVTWSAIQADDDLTIISTLVANLRTEVVIEWCSWLSMLLET
jgi:hypothetical protein